MSWSKLDDRMHEHPKINAMSDRAYRLYMYSITYSSANRLGGRLTPGHCSVLFRLTRATARHADELVKIRAWDVDGEDRIIHDFPQYNPSRDELKEKRSEAGKRGAQARWQNGKPMALAIDGKMANDASRACPDPNPESHKEIDICAHDIQPADQTAAMDSLIVLRQWGASKEEAETVIREFPDKPIAYLKKVINSRREIKPSPGSPGPVNTNRRESATDRAVARYMARKGL